jgi:hypothetical protein
VRLDVEPIRFDVVSADNEIDDPDSDETEPGGDTVDSGQDAAGLVDDGHDDGVYDDYDELPTDLDITGGVAVYEFPNNSKRRIASILYLGVGAICIWLGTAVDSPQVNDGLTVVGIGLVVFAIYSYVVAVDTAVDETDALVIAAETIGFTPGHASAQMSWRGWRSRPLWRILVYSDEEQPVRRALVVVDGVTGEVREHVVEDNPEDWSELIAGV